MLWLPNGFQPSRAALDAGAAASSVSVNATGTKLYHGTADTSATYTGITVASGTNRGLVLAIMWDINSPTSTPTGLTCVWDSGGTNQSMTRIVTSDGGTHDGSAAELWGLVNPATGNLNLALAWTGNARAFIVAMAFNGVDQTGGATSFPHSSSGTGVATLSITSATANIVMNTGGGGTVPGTITGTTIYSDTASGSFINAYSNYDAGAATVVIGSGNANANMAATDIKAA